LFQIAMGAVEAREADPRCGSLVQCSLVNLHLSGGPENVFHPLQRGVIGLDGTGSAATIYDPKDGGREGWSIQCQTEGKIDYTKYFFDDEDVNTHYSTPFWMNGDNSGARINKEDRLSDCGTKSINVKFYSWSGGDEFPCDSATLELEADCPTDKSTFLPTDKPTLVPIDKPTIVPTNKTTIVPTENRTFEPTENPTLVPTKTLTLAPTEQPTLALTNKPTTITN